MHLRDLPAWGLSACLAFHAPLAWSQQVQSPLEILVHDGMCEPSGGAALPITAFAEQFVVANDEDNTLRVYAADRNGGPVSQLDLGVFLGLDVSRDEDDKADIEAAAWLGDRIYWIGSHSRSGKGKPRHQRRQFFATSSQAGISPVAVVPGTRSQSLIGALAEPYPSLDLRKAIGDLRMEQSSLAPEAGGLNIEGLAERPDGASLWIALRNPLQDGNAVVVSLDNPQAVVEGREEPQLGVRVRLDLGGRGVRDITYSATRKGYVVVAGPIGDAGPLSANADLKFRLYAWDGGTSGHTVPLETTDEPMRRLSELKFQPEVIIIDPTGTRVRLLSDDGDLQFADGKPCKDFDGPTQRFRSTVLRLD